MYIKADESTQNRGTQVFFSFIIPLQLFTELKFYALVGIHQVKILVFENKGTGYVW